MQELAGRLTALDPEASESLKVISFFDSLVAGGAGAESIVRGAVMLSGVAAGAIVRERGTRLGADGTRTTDAEPAAWPSASAPPDVRVWIERTGDAHANDAMILERAALALAIVDARRHPDSGPLQMLLDADTAPDERAAAARRLRLPEGPIRVVATPADAPALAGVSTVLVTAGGLVRASVGVSVPESGPAGAAIATTPQELTDAWADARIALRLTDARHPVVHADAYGALFPLLRGLDPAAAPHPDVVALRALDAKTLEILDALAESESVRAAAATLELHHSSLQARLETWSTRLGYDPRSPRGRVRYETARLLSRLA